MKLSARKYPFGSAPHVSAVWLALLFIFCISSCLSVETQEERLAPRRSAGVEPVPISKPENHTNLVLVRVLGEDRKEIRLVRQFV